MPDVVWQRPCTHGHSGTRADIVSIVPSLHHLAHVAFLFTTGHGHDSTSVLWFGTSPVTSTQQPVGQNQSPDLWKVGMYHVPVCPEGEENRCVCTFRVFTQTMLLWPTETWVKGLACCLIPSILGTEKTTRFCSEPHYTRPRGLFITYRGKCHQMQGTVNLGNSHWKSVREKPLLNKIKINLWAVGLQWDDWDYLPDSRRKITSPREVFLGVTDANYRALVWGWLFLGLTHCKFLLK